MILKDSKGMIFSTEFLLTIILFVVILGIVANLMDKSDEKILNSMKTNNLESLSANVADNLISSPGTPKTWEKLTNFNNNVFPGLAIQNENQETLINTISYKKINCLKSSYNVLISKNLFNNEIKSSIAIYPLNKEIEPIVMGDEIKNNENSNVFVVRRLVKCDFLSNLAILSLNNENTIKKNENISENTNETMNEAINENNLKNNLCNHNTINNISHGNLKEYQWICKEFKIKKNSLDNNDYYLIFDGETTTIGGFWILDNTKNMSKIEIPTNNVKNDLNSYFKESLEDENDLIFYLHLKIPQDKKFNCVLVAIPKEMKIEEYNIGYFTSQICEFTLKTSYN